jgi:quercetin dioxygenase-like cupin family protein
MKKLLFLAATLFYIGGIMEVAAQGSIEQNENDGASGVLTAKQEVLCLIAAFTAQGDMPELEQALNKGFDAGLTVNEAREAIVQKAPSTGNEQRVVRRPDMAAFPGGSEHFTGDVAVRFIYMPDSETNVSAAYVTFEPGARTNWHIHARGQRMVITEGVCWTQNEGGQKIVANTGDVIICPAGVKHWHGASPDSRMTHLVLTGGGAQWLERVADDQYLGD